MDFSQQELPLTAYFTRGTKEARSRPVPYKKRSTEGSQSVARSSKRRSNVSCSTASPLGSSSGQSKLRPRTLQLPTPATSARRLRTGCLRDSGLQGNTQLTSTGALPSILPGEKDLAQLEFGPTPSKSPQSSRESSEDALPELSSIPLATPSTDRRKTSWPIDMEFFPGPRHSNRIESGIATPRTSSPRIFEPVHDIDDHSPLARSNSHLSSEPSQASPRIPDSGVSHAVLPYAQHLARSTEGLPCFPVDMDLSDPFYAREKGGVFAPRCAFTPSKQYPIQLERLNGQSSDGHAVPMIPVPSSQSQYLLHLDATPKRKQCSQRIERVISSQTQEERELTLSMPYKPAAIVSLSRVSPGRYMRGGAEFPRLGYSEREHTHVEPPIDSPPSPSRFFFASKKALDELSSKSSSPSRREKLTSYHSPSCKTKMPWGSPCHNSIENIPPVHIEDSLTESESDSDILQMRMRMKDKLTPLDLPSRKMNEVPRHSPVTRDARPPIHCGFAAGNLPGAEDDSATEAESDTEILHCVAEIGRKRPRDHRSEVSREHTPPPPVISPLVSPASSRIGAVPPIIGLAEFPTQEGAELSVSGSCVSYPSGMARPQIPSESLPSVVRDFIRMFPGDESYPADFPESLRV